MEICINKIKFIRENDITQCIYDVIHTWLCELDIETDETKILLLKQKILELEQVYNRTGKPNFHFKDDKKWGIKTV